MRCFFVLFLFIPCVLQPASLSIIYHMDSNGSPAAIASSTSPLSFYQEFLDESFQTDHLFPATVIGGKIVSIHPAELAGLSEKGNCVVHIFITAHYPEMRSKAGVIYDADEIPVRFIFTKNGYSKAELLHELGHALFELGDEYGGSDELYQGSSRYRNLSAVPYVEEWETIKALTGDKNIGYYEGGLGHNRGLFHSYPTCLMQDLHSKLCPVCLFYVIKKMNEITGETKDFIEIARNYEVNNGKY